MYPETEGFMIAIQDQVIQTKNYQKYIEKSGITSDLCRMCKKCSETIQHIISGCSCIANTEYLHRHNLSCKIVHQYLGLKYHLITDSKEYYKYEPRSVIENEDYKLYWDRQVITDKTILSNRPDIILIDKTKKIAFLIDVAHPLDTNLNQTFQNKIIKYRDLAEEIRKMWHLEKTVIIPIIVSANGLIHSNQLEFLEKLNIPEKIIFDIKRNTILETCRITRKVLNIPQD